MIIGIPKETFPEERRVALIPDSISTLKKAGHEIVVESGAGADAGFPDDAYTDKGGTIEADRASLFKKAEMVFQIRGLGMNPEAGTSDLELFREGQKLAAMLDPLGNPQAAKTLADARVTAFSMELIPRITRAQSMDVLSSMATVAGYKAVLVAAASSPRMFPMFMTAAGTITPAHAFIIGAGVAGLQAIATARRLGAVVRAYDVRAAVKEQIESLGAKFVEMDLGADDAEDKGGYAKEMGEEFIKKQRELMNEVCAESDIVITTAAIPGKKSPVLVTADMVANMKPGSVSVDLAAERGGNCELSKADEVVVEHGVTIHGPTNLPGTVPYHASQMYSKNIVSFVRELTSKEGEFVLDMENEVHRETLVAHEGDVINERVKSLLG
ncbi:MAG: Re/Si-specific NAD(P)(+) transhydrogenase subunit alpha [Planctomycetota bacterium]|jgi:NAD(P) transhydrogenase subunit alpha